MSVPAPVISLLVGEASALLFMSLKTPPRWGVYDSSGELILQPTSILDFDDKREWRVPTFPVQDGQFQTYNKVLLPYEVSVRMIVTGAQTDREAFLDVLDDIAGDLNLYTITTPERTYGSVNITRYENARHGAEAAYALTSIDVFFTQVVPGQVNYFSGTANAALASAQPAVANGTVVGQTPSAATATAGGAALSFYPGEGGIGG